MDWKRLLAYLTGSVAQELLRRNEFLAEENRILRNQIKGRVRLSDAERRNLAEIGQRLGRRALEDAAPDRTTGNNPGLAPETGGPEIRRFQAPIQPVDEYRQQHDSFLLPQRILSL
jgi:hypothetical protein